ncbi:MAG: transketolase [Ardenticatenaceae bacterium]|nr:transketolase [Anaerolineales bacterium]MCB8940824.1 transketolase [Ardenticatenaceae bacterium]MCB8972163.1 transketolase [Ardenticatenaceae bacterium]
MTEYNLEFHRQAANTIRGLTMDAVQKAGEGHPGMPMGTADLAVVLWTQFLRHNPQDPTWPDRDRFVLSAGHGSMLIYSLLHLSGYDLPLEELKNFRQWDSKTPGHPEFGHTVGVETTTGPLGQGITNAVGMAIAESWLAARFNKPGHAIVNHHTYAIAGDGDLMEGVSQEAASLAGHLGLSKLIVLYDDNRITIDGTTDIAFTEDTMARFAAYGWHTQKVDGHDPLAVKAAIEAAKNDGKRPSIIACRTHIGFGSPNKQDTSGVHGSALGDAEIVLTKQALGWPTEPLFYIPDAARDFLHRDGRFQAEWETVWESYLATYPEDAARFQQFLNGDLPTNWDDILPTFEAGKSLATRAASGQTLNAIAPHVPYLLGGSADLTGSNNTDIKGETGFTKDDFSGRYIYFGVREHAMGGILNGMALHGGVRPYGGTFLVFSDYMRGSVRLAALMGVPVIYVFTHDSIGLGTDGPTHQPIEHVMSLRAMPNLTVIRPADGDETAVAWQSALENVTGPTALILSRQGVPNLDRSKFASAAGAAKGAYVLSDADKPQVLLLATGSEVQIALEAQAKLAEKGVAARVVSMPSWELFAAQDAAYRESVLPAAITARVSIEAGVTLGWERYLGLGGKAIGLDRYGASAPYKAIYQNLGIIAEAMVAAALELVG